MAGALLSAPFFFFELAPLVDLFVQDKFSRPAQLCVDPMSTMQTAPLIASAVPRPNGNAAQQQLAMIAMQAGALQGGGVHQDSPSRDTGGSAAGSDQESRALAQSNSSARHAKRLSFKIADPQGITRMVMMARSALQHSPGIFRAGGQSAALTQVVNMLQHEPLFQLDGVYGLVFSSVQTQWKNLLALAAEGEKDAADAGGDGPGPAINRPAINSSLSQVPPLSKP